MAQLGRNFDASGVPPKTDFENLPPGDYPVMIVASEMKATKDGAGNFLSLELEVTDGPAKGRKLWDRLNLVNKNEKAVEIAERTLSAICHATGVMNVQDSEQLHGRTMLAKVKIGKAQEGYAPRNEISTYEPIAGGAAQANPTPAATPAAHVAATASRQSGPATTPPWRK